MAARYQIPRINIQTCHNHFKEDIRRELRVRSDSTYKEFMNLIEELLGHKHSNEVFEEKLFYIYKKYREDEIAVSVITNIDKYKKELLAYRGIPGSPITSNLMECFNSHLKARIKSIRSFESFSHADRWLNGYILKRRFAKYTDCKGKFRSLNGRRPIDMSTKGYIDDLFK